MVQIKEGYTVKNDNWSHECDSATGRSYMLESLFMDLKGSYTV